MNTRKSIVVLSAIAALATTALAPTSASAWVAGHPGGATNTTLGQPDTGHHPSGSTSNTGSTSMPNTGSTSTPMPTHTTQGTPPPNGQNGQGGWPGGNPNHPSNGDGAGSQGSHGPWSQGGGHGPWSQGGDHGPWSQAEHNQPCGYGGCGDVWHRHRPYGTVYAPVETYTAPVYAPPPVYTQAPVYQAPVQTTYAPAPQTYVAPTVQTYAPAPPPAPCTCLTKSYAQDGSVMFADNCTKESAVAAPQQAHY
jgi:hypothetical protein